MYYGGRLFRAATLSGRSETTADTIFKYEQVGNLIMATYSGGDIRYGQMVGKVQDDNTLDMRYQHMNRMDKIRTGICKTTPEALPGGKLRLHESWYWTCGDESAGSSILEEI